MQYKIKAFLTHFSISAVIVASFLLLVFFVWYPKPLMDAEGGWDIIILLVVIDLILGPLMTFVVFKPDKKSLKFDLSVIVLIQIVALVYGGSIIYSGRPVYVVFNVNKFHVITQSTVGDLTKLKNESLKTGIFDLPNYIFMNYKENMDKAVKIYEELLAGNGKSIVFRPEMYDFYEPHLPEWIDKGIKFEDILKFLSKLNMQADYNQMHVCLISF